MQRREEEAKVERMGSPRNREEDLSPSAAVRDKEETGHDGDAQKRMGSEFSGLLFFSFARRKRASFIFFSSLVDFCVMSYTSLEKWRLTKSEFSQLHVFNRESVTPLRRPTILDKFGRGASPDAASFDDEFSRILEREKDVLGSEKRERRGGGEMCQRCRRRDRREI